MPTPFSTKAPLQDPEQIVAFCHANVLTPQGIQTNQTLQWQHGKIKSISGEAPLGHLLRDDDIHTIQLNDDFLVSPGLIDLQLNGAFGVDFSTGTIPQIQKVLDILPQYGITALLPTLVTAPLMDMASSCNQLEELIHFNQRSKGSRLLGIHLEGPFLNPQKRGTHPQEAIVKGDLENLRILLSPHVKMMTYAPECDEDFELLHELVAQRILPFAGHTQVERASLKAHMAEGLKGVTHLYNAMAGYTHRQVGAALHVLNEPDLWASVIADGFHVHPEVLELTLKLKGTKRLVLVSDAMNLAGLKDGESTRFAGTHVRKEGGRAVNTEGNLAGSTQLLPEMIRNLIRWNLCTWEEALHMATYNPAKLLGIEQDYGVLQPHAVADMLLWHKPTMQIIATWIAGELRWRDSSFFTPQANASLGTANPTREALPPQANLTL